MRPNDLDPELEKAMAESLRLYAEGDERFFDYLTDDVRVYSIDSVEPSTSREAFQGAFASSLTATKRDVRVLNADVQAKDDQAVLAQTLEMTIDAITVFLRQTVIWERGGRGWQMSHIHNALAGRPITALGELPQTAREVQVLNERIATVAAAVGVAQ
jgi:hypothetical protein